MPSHKFDLEKFHGSKYFTLWMMKMNSLLVQQGCEATLEEEEKVPKDMTAKRKIDILARAHSSILLSLIDKVLI